MCPNSSTSSTEVQNGSSYSESTCENEFSSSPSYPTATNGRCAGSDSSNQRHINDNMSGDQPYHSMNRTYSSGTRSDITSTNEGMLMPENRIGAQVSNFASVLAGCYPNQGHSHTADPAYRRELEIEKGRLGSANGSSNYQTRLPYPGATHQSEQTPVYRSLVSNCTVHQESPTTRRWSTEDCPEERLRLGLPRWESDKHRAEYERGLRG